ncbi:MAG: sugar phosphate isomerase/epimerase [Candidatus Goldbacteria bacterium]|nr:sugar phosphate isomerase/epimerase [Candidatus Goldiibacteriota bacterium]
MSYKLSATTWSHHHSIETGKLDDSGLIELYAKEGLGGIEFIMEHIKDHNEKHLRALRKKANDAGLEICAVSPGNNFGNEKEKDNKANLDYVKKSVDTAEILGASFVRVFAGWPPQGKREALWNNAVKYMKEAAKYAEKKGITLVVEPHNHGGFLPDSKSSIKFIEDVNSPYVRLNVDTGNYLGFDEDIYKGIADSMKYALYCHLKVHKISKDGQTSDFDMDRIFRILSDAKYSGWITIEYEGQEFLQAEKEEKSKNEFEFFGIAVKKAKDMIKKYY